ncbi:MAG TPA: DUF885 domain-containing protein [Solirubrobacteraceae bacterium]|nr:DUF885 domain-containing protein [Solirubrobacteraceae bacterium]
MEEANPRGKASGVRELADTFHERWLAAYPFIASIYGITGYDDRVPDESEGGEAARRAELELVLAELDGFDASQLSDADAVTLGCLVENVHQELRAIDARLIEHTVSAIPVGGPPLFLGIAARTVIGDAPGADAYLERLRRSGEYLDQQTERLRIGAAKGRLPVAPLVVEALEWAESVLKEPMPEAVAAPEPPEGWEAETAWREERDALAAGVVKPALARWTELLRELLPQARPGEQAGLVHLPGGEADYARCLESFTTLPLTAEEIHRIGLEEVERFEALLLELGAELKLSSLAAIHRAARESSKLRRPEDAIAAATAAIRRAEAATPEYFPPPPLPPCDVAPMPSVIASAGMAPHYSPPRLDGERPGTYWFNLERPTAGTGWDLEVVAFHEGVPGHHLQLSRIRMLDLPDMQRQRALSVFSEGWALYAEQLADEMGLYPDTESRIGALVTSLLRAARLVVDTGLHALAWSRQRAIDFLVAHVPMPEAFLADEVDRYIVYPAQAVTYQIGKRELLRLRAEAERRLGSRFALPEFHAAVLDSGSLPMPVLDDKLRRWSASSVSVRSRSASTRMT